MHTRKADLAPLATLRQCRSISSMRTSLVSSMPRATIASESPTRTISMPAWSATCAEGKSWAVMTVMGSFLRYSDIIVGSVTFLRAGDDELPSGECDD
mgnify:CR=1 FL=1